MHSLIMKSVAITILVALSSHSVFGWGGLFNRFNPSMLSNLGYEGSYGKELYGAANKHGPEGTSFMMSEGEDARHGGERSHQADLCSPGKTCTANEHCCDGQVCVDNDDTIGRCLPIWGKQQGEACHRDNDCESGFLCLEDGSRRTCQTPVPGLKELGEDCTTSSDCNLSKGFCCKLHRRAKSLPKKTCSYFADAQTCIGSVAGNFIIPGLEHTAGEKRLSGHPDDFLHLK